MKIEPALFVLTVTEKNIQAWIYDVDKRRKSLKSYLGQKPRTAHKNSSSQHGYHIMIIKTTTDTSLLWILWDSEDMIKAVKESSSRLDVFTLLLFICLFAYQAFQKLPSFFTDTFVNFNSG